MRSTTLRLGAVATTLLLLLIPCAGAAQESEEDHHVRIEIKKQIRACDDDEDCEKAEHRFVVIDEDGEALDGDEDGYLWVPGGHRRLDFHHPSSFSGGYLGVGLTELTDELRVHFGVPGEAGVMVSKVFEGSPAEQAGIRVGDIVTAVDGEAVRSAGSLARKIRALDGGDTAGVELVRDGRLQTVAVVVEEQKRRPRMARAYVLGCDDEDEDCLTDITIGGDHHFQAHELFACDDCSIVIDCDGGECSCTVDGETTDCPELEHLPGIRTR